MEDCEIGVLTETRCGAKEGTRSYRAVALTSVMSKWYASCIILRLQNESWKKLHVGGVDGICQHLQVMIADLLQKHWERQEERTPMLRHGSVDHTTMCLASMDIKTAFDEARPRHVAKIMESHSTQGWIVSALPREVCGLEGQAMFRTCGEQFLIQSRPPPRKRRSSQIAAKDGHAAHGKSEGKLDKKNNGASF